MAPSPAGGRGRRGGGGGSLRGRGGGAGARGPQQQGNGAVGPLASLTAEEVQIALDREIDNLANEDAAAATRAAAVVMALSTREEAHPLLPRAVPKLVQLLAHGKDMHCKRNACAALGAITSASHELLRTVVFADPSPVPFLVDSLTAEAGLRINAAHTLSLLAQESEGRAALAEAEASVGLIASLSVTNVIAEGSDCAGSAAAPAAPAGAAAEAAPAEVSASTALRARCLEASVDALCTLAASYGEDGRRDLVEKGAVEAIAALLLPLPHPAEAAAAAAPAQAHTPTQTQTRAQEQEQADSNRTGHPTASSSSSLHASASSSPSQTMPASAPAAAAAAAAAAEAAQNELHLRSLLAIGMLLNADPSAAQRLASVEGALARLPALARSSDADVLAVAVDMLGTVARHPQLKEQLAQQLRASASAKSAVEGST